MAVILKNVKCDIYAADWLILTKFGTMMHTNSPNPIGDQKFDNSKIQDGGWWPSWK